MPKLIQAPDGSWVDPSFVTAVTASQPYGPLSGKSRLAKVTVSCGGSSLTVDMPSYEEAQKVRDHFAAQVNGATSAINRRSTEKP